MFIVNLAEFNSHKVLKTEMFENNLTDKTPSSVKNEIER